MCLPGQRPTAGRQRTNSFFTYSTVEDTLIETATERPEVPIRRLEDPRFAEPVRAVAVNRAKQRRGHRSTYGRRISQ